MPTAVQSAEVPWYVEAVTPKKLVPPVPLPPTDAAGEPRRQQPRPPSRRFRWYGVGIAACVLAGGLLLLLIQPKPQAAEKPSGKEDGALPIIASIPAPKEDGAPPVLASIPAPPEPKPLADAPRPPPREVAAPVRELVLPAPLPAPALAERDAPPALPKPAVAGPPTVRVAHPVTCPDRATEEDLRQQLASVPKVGLSKRRNHCGDPVVLESYAKWPKPLDGRPRLYDATPLLRAEPELRTLPFRQGPSQQLNRKAAANLEVLSHKLHAYLDAFAPPGPDGQRVVTAALRDALHSERRGKRPEWLRPEAVPALLQILMAEDKVLRCLLVKLLADIPGPKASRALAQRAVFDLDDEIRRLALAALKGRRAEEYRTVLVKALRYPWPPPAAHAAEALAHLRDAAAASALVALLSLPDPARPQTTESGRNVLQEVVCIQHVRSCILCHPPAETLSDPHLGEDPLLTVLTSVPRSALPDLARAGALRPGSYGGAGVLVIDDGRGNSVKVQLSLKVRSDISFLRQDFSVLQPVAGPRPKTGPLAAERQRFDYVIRTRPLSPRELRRWREKKPADPLAYPQRQAVLFALRGVTGRDVGDTTEAWQKLFPRAELDAAVDHLRKALRRADVVGQVRLLARVRDREGPLWSPALARVIPDLRGEVQQKAREFLAGRLARLSARDLRERLRDVDPEIARAALQAGVQNKEMELVPDLIAQLEEPNPRKAQLARAGLIRLTGQSLPEPAAWRAWWKKQEKERGGK